MERGDASREVGGYMFFGGGGCLNEGVRVMFIFAGRVMGERALHASWHEGGWGSDS